MTDAGNGAGFINGTPLSPNGSTNPPMNAGVGADGAGVHTSGSPMITDAARLGDGNLIEDPVDQQVVRQLMTGVPIDQITRHIPSITRKGMEYEFYSIDERKCSTSVTEAVVATDGTATIKVEDGSFINIGDTLLVKDVPAMAEADRSVGNPKDGAPLRLYVVGYNQSNRKHLQAVAINGKDLSNNETRVPAIGVGTVIYRIANAAKEGEMQGNIYSALPTKKKRFMQIFKVQVAWSSIMKDSDKEVPWTMDEDADMALRELRKSIERAYIFGVQKYFYDATKNMWVYTCGGILEQMLEGSRLLPYKPNQLTDEKFLLENLVHPIFLDNSGSAKRYMFSGSGLIAKIATLPGIQKQMDAKNVERKFGIDWKVIQFMTWSLDMYQHPLLDEMGMRNCAIILDLVYIQKAVFRALSQDILELKKSGTFDGDSIVWTEISSICLKYPQVHALIFDPDEWDPDGSYHEESSASSSASSSSSAA